MQKKESLFSASDKNRIIELGLSAKQIESQLERFKKGFKSLSICRPAVEGDGIKRLSEEDADRFISLYDNSDVRVTKFVPASGAASRMFKSLFSFIGVFEGSKKSYEEIVRKEKEVDKFFSHLDEFAFYEELERVVIKKLGKSIEYAKKEYLHSDILKLLLTDEGLNYGNLPKGLLKFHRYEDELRTAAQEHVHEGLAYALRQSEVNLHFTVSPEHLELFQEHISNTIRNMTPSVTFAVTYSVQESSTDTIASTLDFSPFRNHEGELLFRPAGHGALLENLNRLTSDVVFIKNIDNVVPDSKKSQTIKFKKALGGVLLSYQQKVFDLLERNDQGEDIATSGRELLEDMGAKNFSDEDVATLLNRPIRICGMVKNEGEPGGGPFWVRNGSFESLQIVESAQVDVSDSEQVKIFGRGTHFNPVDLVCGIINYKGEKFDLMKYRDDEAGFISEKSFDGQKLLAMELPGLWNGSMADWNTIFVEVPLITFNPVKTVIDLQKPTHC